jgi:very-short-patch-repair endonuclease
MRSHNIVVDEHTQRGARALRDYLEYAEHGKLEAGIVTGREPQSEFEVAVARVLKNNGYKVVPQVGVAGYFIDMAVCHPGSSSSFALGIECDGATYHRAKSARDRDRLREEALRNLGWKLYRVWSTDWFSNPKREIEKLLEAVGAALGKEPTRELERSFNRPSSEPERPEKIVASPRVDLDRPGSPESGAERFVASTKRVKAQRDEVTPEMLLDTVGEGGRIDRESLVVALANALGTTADRRLRSLVNKAIFAAVKSGKLKTDWKAVWR